MTQPFRLPRGGRIDRSRRLAFSFDGRVYEGHPGDTLASALLANGVRLVARSLKYHRPRGIFAAGSEEPSALVQLETGAYTEPNRRATEIELYNGLVARSQNAWPSLGADLGAVADLVSPLLVAGFYYKTFIRPRATWCAVWEPLLRRMAGQGRAPALPDPARYDKTHAHCDVLVVGAGPAGLAAALAAGRAGARVILADEGTGLGGSLSSQPCRIGERDGAEWVGAAAAELAALPEMRLLPRTTVFGAYDGNCLMAVERIGERFGPAARPGLPRQRLWHIRARRVVLATGALERSLVFAGNDRPGVMLAGAVESYANRYAVACGRRAVLFTNNDSAYRAARALLAAGIELAAIVDLRAEPGPAARRGLADVPLYPDYAVVATDGRKALASVEIRPLGPGGLSLGSEARRIDCDLLAVSGGSSPAVHLFSQAQGRLTFDERPAAFVPGEAPEGVECVGAARGRFVLDRCLAEGAEAGARAALFCGFGDGRTPAMPPVEEAAEVPLRPLWLIASPRRGAKAFVDLQNDVTAADIALAAREGFVAVEHVKRYTTLGMGTDQGKTGNIAGAALLSEAIGRAIAETGTTSFRPPYTPVTFGALAGRERGERFDPVRETPMHDWHAAAGAVFEDVGQWRRPRFYPHAGEDMTAAVKRECLAARDGVAILDASTLGKIEVAGPDAARFLDRVYTNRIGTLAAGRCRYGLMCRDDGMVFDDGVVTRLGPEHFFLTTTTGNAGVVFDWLEEWLQTEWSEFQVFCTSVTEQWANATVVGPRSREVLAALAPDLALDRHSFPFMAMREAEIAGMPARIFRVSFSGELSYEVNVPASDGPVLWERLIEAGAGFGIAPYGTEAMHVLRAEKGYMMVGHETDGSVTPLDLGLAGLVAGDKDFLGRRSLKRRDLAREDRKQLVGLLPEDARAVLPEGAQLVAGLRPYPPMAMIGHVTSSYFGPRIGRSFALALVEAGRARHGERIWAVGDRILAARIVAPIFYDPEGRRRDG